MALNSCEASERIENSIGVDRFSNLPDEIVHKIMSVLSFKDLTCVGCASKRCKNLQLSLSSIILLARGENVENMLDSFNNFMIQRGDNKMQRFMFMYCSSRRSTDIDEVESPTECFEKFRWSAWINSAVRCNVEELSVQLYATHNVLFTVPSALFLLGSLKSLYLWMKCVIGGEVSLSPSLSNLASLTLACVSVIDESFWRWISCSCKRLQTLTLRDIYGSKNIIIENPSLKTVRVSLLEGDCCNLSIWGNRLEDIRIDWGCTSSNNSVNIFAPKVKFFNWGGRFSSHLNLGEMRFLNEGCISSDHEVTEFATLVYVLCSMRCVKTLDLNNPVIKTLSKDGVTFAPLNEVRCLRVPCFFTDDLVPGLVRLLQRTPSLESLCLKAHLCAYAMNADLLNLFDDDGFDMEFWKQQNLAFINCIKNIAIALYSGSNAFEFARYILKHARNLERMDIFCVPNLYDEVIKLQDDMISSGTLIIHQVLANNMYYEMMFKFLRLVH